MGCGYAHDLFVVMRDAPAGSAQLGRLCCVAGWRAMATHVLP
jgi:hypothetical protein